MIAWHYTTKPKYELIVGDGLLKPAEAGVFPPELPILWFSINQHFEPSAKKGLQGSDGSIRQATLEEMLELSGGLYRFGRPIFGLKCGDGLRKAAKMRLGDWKRLLASARHMKASSYDWYGHVGQPLSIAEMSIEIMDDDFRWKPLS